MVTMSTTVVKLHMDREICARRVQRTHMNVTRALARSNTNERHQSIRTTYAEYLCQFFLEAHIKQSVSFV
jgi:hypothetical protein